MKFQNRVVQSIRSTVLIKILMGAKTVNYLTIVNKIEKNYSVKLTQKERLIVQKFTHDLVKTLNSWAPVLREIRSAAASVKVPR